MTEGPEELPLRERVDQFREAIAPDLYLADVFIPWPLVDIVTSNLKRPIALLQEWVDAPRASVTRLAEALNQDRSVLEVLQYLFVAPGEVGFADGRELPGKAPTDAAGRYQLATLALDLGLRRVLPRGARVEDVVRHGVVAVDARRRGFRRRDTVEDRVRALLRDAITEVRTRTGVSVAELPSSAQPPAARGRVRSVIGVEGVPVAAVANVFQAQTGGRQQRDLQNTYPRLQEDLDALPAHLLLIADGQGVRQAPQAALQTLLEAVAAVMTTSQAEAGGLADALESAVVNRGARRARRASVLTLVSGLLETRPRVKATDLPVPRETALVALSQYKTEHPDLALNFDAAAEALEWRHPRLVKSAQGLKTDFDANRAIELLARRLRMKSPSKLEISDHGVEAVKGPLPADRVLPGTLVVAASARPVEERDVRAVGRAAREDSADANIAVFISPSSAQWHASPLSRSVQQSLATSVVVVDPDDLFGISSAESPRDAFVQIVLQQADLSKANPFNTAGATPQSMYFGRNQEEARVRATLRGNSVALIGGRRIGKTSLMHRLLSRLRDDGWNAHYADCQEAGGWETFASLIALRWDVSVDAVFAPSHMTTIVRQLARRAKGSRVVILLDEIDHLLRWDQVHDDGNVPEALFRACRALSQQGDAQFVFSGERFVSERLWDPASPHWNFCRPVPVKQLARQAADNLLIQPLEDLGVEIVDQESFREASWTRTQGHPYITQFLGERLVLALNARAADERGLLSPDDVAAIGDGVEYRRHYAETYWGQATPLERLITSLVVQGATAVDGLRAELASVGVERDAVSINRALQMLGLYGIVDEVQGTIRLRASWFPEALEALGGDDAVAADEVERLRG